jgi:rhamnulokinase
LLEQFSLPARIFPDLVEPGTKLGALRSSVAARTGLGLVEVVAPATHDTGSAVVGVPTRNTGRPNWAYISSGTWSLLGVEVDRPVLTAEALRQNVTNEGGVDGSSRLLKNIMGLWLLQRCRAAFETRGSPGDYAALVRLAQASPALRSLVDPDHPRFLNPPDMPAAIASFCAETGQPIPETEGAIARCVLESLALKYSLVLDGIEGLTGCRVEIIHVVGGGSRNALLNQFTAEACDRPVIAGPVEATVLGNLLTQARAFGEIGSLAQLREVVRGSSELIEYTPSQPAGWLAAREKMSKLCLHDQAS